MISRDLPHPNGQIARDRGLHATVLVVDDDEAMRNSLSFALRAQGFNVRAFASAADVLAISFPECGCLIVDCHLEDMDAFALLAELRRRQIQLPALIVTNAVSVDTCRRALNCGSPLLELPLFTPALPCWVQALIEKQCERCTSAAEHSQP